MLFGYSLRVPSVRGINLKKVAKKLNTQNADLVVTRFQHMLTEIINK